MGSRTSIKAVTDDLRFAVERMFRGRDISVKLCSKGDCRFSGEVQDLEEMLGIVKDIAELYGGSIRLGKSPLGGLKAELELPAAT